MAMPKKTSPPTMNGKFSLPSWFACSSLKKTVTRKPTAMKTTLAPIAFAIQPCTTSCFVTRRDKRLPSGSTEPA
jgi:hypothetical protein